MSMKVFSDADPTETREWLESLEYVLKNKGTERARFLMQALRDRMLSIGAPVQFRASTPPVNTIPLDRQAPYPGDRKIARRIKSYVRWNAMAMVVRANRRSPGIGGHISTYASSATLLEVGFNHFFRASSSDRIGDQIFFQGHAAPGIYARAYIERRLDPPHLHNFRRELQKEPGLPSYPHPWLMPDFWEFPTVSMGLSPITSIYQARFNRYLHDRGLADTEGSRVWAFLGDGEMDEPESLGAITLASREELDNLTWVVNCNLQRLDGPVRGNGSIIHELEAAFRGAGWNVIKVLWGDDWDKLFVKDEDGLLVRRMQGVVDGQWQKYSVESGDFIRRDFFGTDPRLEALVADLSDAQLEKLRLGGHDPEKVYAAYKVATEHRGAPTVVLARTIKGYGLGEAGEGRNVTHQQKKMNEDELKEFRDRFEIPISDREVLDAPFYRPPADSPEFEYIRERRAALGGAIPRRMVRSEPLEVPSDRVFTEFDKGSKGREVATTMAFVRVLSKLLADKKLGKLIVPIVPDEARTFGMDALFRQYGIYAHAGQKYEPVDSNHLLYYHEAENGQILEEGITEAGSMASFTAAGTAYVTHGINSIPFYVFYSMFGCQRIGDSIWAFGDMRGKGFLIGATSGRTTLAGEGLQHQDGHSHLLASTVPNLLSYDPAFAFEVAAIIKEGIRRMYHERDDIFYYITVGNEPYEQPPKPDGVDDAILKGLYRFRRGAKNRNRPGIHLFGSGSIMNEVLRAQQILEDEYNVRADAWSVTSYSQLRREALMVDRWNRLHPTAKPRRSFFARQLQSDPWPIVASGDYMKIVPEQLTRWAPAGLTALGTDGYGRSDARKELRRFFEVDAEHVVVAALKVLADRGEAESTLVADAIAEFQIDPEAPDPARA